MDQPMDTLAFNGMFLLFKIRDLIIPPRSVLSEVGIKPGFQVLDYGCGPGGFSIVAAELAGPSGKVYAADIEALALRRVWTLASKKSLSNIETIHTDCATGLENGSVDVVLMYDIYHMFSTPDRILEELHRVLKPKAILSFSDHHMRENAILSGVTHSGLFGLSRKGKRTYSFVRKGQ
jgi:ubiquinone/menaquinone biosynthesis C-methylase UbiE